MLTSQESTSHLVEAILGRVDFDPQVHTATMEAGRAGGKKGRMSYTQVYSLTFSLNTLLIEYGV
eukprot:4301297-Ditylum_brightwellii.AAC.1